MTADGKSEEPPPAKAGGVVLGGRVFCDSPKVDRETVLQHSSMHMLADEYIVRGYRKPESSCWQTFASLFSLHNETMNIWTHLVGAITVVALATHWLASSAPTAQVLESALSRVLHVDPSELWEVHGLTRTFVAHGAHTPLGFVAFVWPPAGAESEGAAEWFADAAGCEADLGLAQCAESRWAAVADEYVHRFGLVGAYGLTPLEARPALSDRRLMARLLRRRLHRFRSRLRDVGRLLSAEGEATKEKLRGEWERLMDVSRTRWSASESAFREFADDTAHLVADSWHWIEHHVLHEVLASSREADLGGSATATAYASPSAPAASSAALASPSPPASSLSAPSSSFPYWSYSLSTHVSRWPMFIFLLSALTCLSASVVFHWFQILDRAWFSFLARMDYVGIAVLICGSNIPILAYGFHCRSDWMYFHIGYSVLTCTICAFVGLSEVFAKNDYRAFRASVFILTGCAGVVPLAHLLFSRVSQHPEVMWVMIKIVIHGLLYVTGAVIYATRVPERCVKSKFDIFFSSHQIFHCFVVAAVVIHYTSVLDLYHWRLEHATCDAASRHDFPSVW